MPTRHAFFIRIANDGPWLNAAKIAKRILERVINKPGLVPRINLVVVSGVTEVPD